jgi:predicted tellurium resistance membrane protein TerC
MAEQSVQIQHDALKYQARSHILGQVFAFVLTLASLGVGAWLLGEDEDLAGLVALITGVGVIVNSIIRQNKGDKNGGKRG